MQCCQKDTVFKCWPFWWCPRFTARFISRCSSPGSWLWWLCWTLTAFHSASTQLYNTDINWKATPNILIKFLHRNLVHHVQSNRASAWYSTNRQYTKTNHMMHSFHSPLSLLIFRHSNDNFSQATRRTLCVDGVEGAWGALDRLRQTWVTRRQRSNSMQWQGDKNIGQKTPKLGPTAIRRKPGRTARIDIEAREGRQAARSRQETAREA